MNISRTLPEIKTLLGPTKSPIQLESLNPATGELGDSFQLSGVEDPIPSPYSPHLVGVAPHQGMDRFGKSIGLKAIVWPEENRVVHTQVPAYDNAAFDKNLPVFSPDGLKVAFQTPTRLWVVDAHSGQTVLEKGMHLRDQVAFSPDGKSVLCPGRNTQEHLQVNADLAKFTEPTLELIDVSTGKTQAKQISDLKSLSFTPDGDVLGVSGNEVVKMKRNPGGLVGWLKNGTQKFVTEWSSGKLDEYPLRRTPILSPDGERVAVAASSGFAILNADSGRLEAQSSVRPWIKDSLAWSPDGKYLASSIPGAKHHEYNLQIFDGHTLEPGESLSLREGPSTVGFTSEGKAVATVREGHNSHSIFTLDPLTGESSSQRLEGVDYRSINLNHEGHAVLVRKPVSPVVDEVSAQEWMTLYEKTVSDARDADDQFGDTDPRPNAYKGEMSTPQGKFALEATELDSEHPKVTYNWTGNVKTVELKADGRQITAKSEHRPSWQQRIYTLDQTTGELLDEKFLAPR